MVIYFAFATIGICFAVSLISFKLNYPIHLKILSVLIGCAFLTEIWAIFLFKPLRLGSNMPLYNAYILVEYSAYALYFRLILRRGVMKKIATWFLYVFPLFWVITTFFVFGVKAWNSYAVVAGCLFTVCFALTYYFQAFTALEMTGLYFHSELWIATGLILYYSCQLPFAGMLNFLTIKFRTLAFDLLVVLQVLNIVMYLIFTYAFLCRMNIKKY